MAQTLWQAIKDVATQRAVRDQDERIARLEAAVAALENSVRQLQG